MTEERSYPLDIRGEMSPDLSRWLWMVKWLLAMPHFIVLIFLSLAAFVVWFIAWWAILFTARYPTWMFNYIVGVMRWWWRVSFYSIYPLGTDRYPPFSLAPNDDYPADLSVQYPERLSRVKVIFKWWLLAIPHYIVVTFFIGAGVLLENAVKEIAIGIGVLQYGLEKGDEAGAELGSSLIEIGATNLFIGIIFAIGLAGTLATIAMIRLLFKGNYPLDIFELVMGMQRWSIPRIRLLRPTLRQLPALPPEAITG